MKNKLFYVIMLGLSVLAMSCASTKNTTAVEKTEDLKKKLFNGNWVISSVEEDPGLKLAPDLTMFEIGDAQCFKGSVWNLISNNNTGVINIQGSQKCNPNSYNIVWTVVGDAYNFKFVENRSTAKTVTTGYTLTVLNISETTMKLKTSARFLNKDCPVIFNFIKQ